MKKDKESIKKKMEEIPVPKAHKRKPYQITNRSMACVFSVFLVFFGIACILFTEQIHRIFRYMLGTNMVLLGICELYRGIKLKEFRNQETKLTSNGIVILILGSIILLYRGNVDSIIGSSWGTIGLLKGSEELNTAICECASKKPFLGKAIYAVVEILLAILLLLDPATAVPHHLGLLGIEMIFYGIQLIWEIGKKDE